VREGGRGKEHFCKRQILKKYQWREGCWDGTLGLFFFYSFSGSSAFVFPSWRS
jgi:hypothetical protein